MTVKSVQVTWSPTTEAGTEGSAIPLGTITETLSGLTAETLIISGIPVGAVLSDGTHSFTATAGSTSADGAGSTSVNVAGWNLSRLTITPSNDSSFKLVVTATARSSSGQTYVASASEAVTVDPLAPTVAWSPITPSGVEGSPIALGTLSSAVNSLSGDKNTLKSLVVSGIPVGAVLSDGTHSFTAAKGSTSVNVTGWTLSSLTITPPNDTSFTLTATATEQDAAGNTSSASASETVTVDPLAPTIAWSPATASGVEGSAIELGTLSATVNGLTGDSNSLQSLVISGIPVGAVLSDGTHSFTAAAGSTSVNVTGWALSSLTITPPSDTNFTLTATATEQDAAGSTSSASASEAVTVTAPTVGVTVAWSPSSATGVEGSSIGLGTIGDTLSSTTLLSLVVSGLPVGAVLSDGTHSFTAAAGSTSVNVAGWSLSSLAVTPPNDTSFTLAATATAQDSHGNTYTANASEAVTVDPLAPTVAWGDPSGVEGSPIALGTLSDTVNGLSGDSNTLQSLVVSGLPVGAVLSDGTHSFTAAVGSTSVNVMSWSLTSLTVTPPNDTNFMLTATATEQDVAGNTDSANASERVTVSPLAPTIGWSAATVTGTEGSAIALGTLSDTVNGLTGDSNSLQSLMLAGIPVGATLADGTHSFTAAAGSTSVNVMGWNLANLSVTPPNDTSFTLTATATEQDAGGATSSASANEAVTVDPLAPSVTWSPGSASGTAGSAIALGTLSDTVNGLSGDSNSLQSLVVAGIPAGATLADGTNSFTATTGDTSVNMAGWNLSNLMITAASATAFTLTATATEQSAAGATSSASATEAVTVNAASSPGTPQLPNLFSSYPVRPSWQVAGVDYYVGVPAGTTLKDPASPGVLPAGVSISGQNIIVSANNVTLSGFDFSLNGSYDVVVDGVSGTTITDNNFLSDSNTIGVYIAPGSSNTTITHNTIDGGGVNGDSSFGALIYDLSSGPTAIEYNWIKNAPQQFVDEEGGGTLTYDYNLLENGGFYTGAHLNYLQFDSSNAFADPQVEYNTMVQDVTLSGGEGFQLYDNGTGSITGGTIAYNTLITIPSGATMAESTIIHAGSGSQYPASVTGTVNNNYIDPSGAYNVFYPGLSGVTYSNNINLVTGAQIPGP